MAWISAALIVLAALVAVPCLVLFTQCLVAALPMKDRSTDRYFARTADRRPRART